MVIFVDVDETIFHSPDVPNYSTSIPIIKNIEKINKLFDLGHTIIYWTARGSKTKKDWYQITLNQFKKYNVKFTELRMGKPYYDLIIDDKSKRIEELL